MPQPERSPEILWDHGTAYDFFESLLVLYDPADYGLRASWAAGIRSRLSAPTREVFAFTTTTVTVPLEWLYALPGPKTARSVLDALEAMPSDDILPSLTTSFCEPEPITVLLSDIRRRGQWSPSDKEAMTAFMMSTDRKAPSEKTGGMDKWLDAWAHAAEFGTQFRAGLREYYEVFFREEERRIQPAIERALANARGLAARLSPAKLFEELSQGISGEQFLAHRFLVLVPCYWCSPRSIYSGCGVNDERMIVLFGARPPEASLIPGDAIPAHLLLALEALSDPTRLSILRAIISAPLAQAEIARTLRLRPPTISHHLKSLRIAGLLMHIEMDKAETRYGARIQQLGQTGDVLRDFPEIAAGGGAVDSAAADSIAAPLQ